MHPMTDAHVLGKLPHLFNVSFERIQINDQTRSLDVRLGHADGCGNVIAYFKAIMINLFIHAPIPHKSGVESGQLL